MNFEQYLTALLKSAVREALQEVAAAARARQSQTKPIETADGDDTPVEPAVKTKRASKKVEAAVEPISSESSDETPGASVAKTGEITYDDLKLVVLDYITAHGKDAARKIFEQFGVAKAPELKPEQWPEAYDLFKNAA